MNQTLKLALVLMAIGGLSLASVWTSTNRILSLVFGIGGMLVILVGLMIMSAWADQKNKEELSDAYDPNFTYNKKKFKAHQYLSYFLLFVVLILLTIGESYFQPLRKEGLFVLLFGGISALLSTGIVTLLYKRIPELRVPSEKGQSISGIYFFGLTALLLYAFFFLNYKTAMGSEPFQQTFLLVEKDKTYQRFKSIKLFCDEDEKQFSPTKEEWLTLEKGDSVIVTAQKGKLGFEYFIKFEKK